MSILLGMNSRQTHAEYAQIYAKHARLHFIPPWQAEKKFTTTENTETIRLHFITPLQAEKMKKKNNFIFRISVDQHHQR